MKIYFAGSIRGGRQFQSYYATIITKLKEHGTVLTEHIGSMDLSESGEKGLNDNEIFLRDKDWIIQSDVIVAEVSNPSLGVGYELGLAESLNKPVFCLHCSDNKNPLSAMVAGNKRFKIAEYANLTDIEKTISEFFNMI